MLIQGQKVWKEQESEKCFTLSIKKKEKKKTAKASTRLMEG